MKTLIKSANFGISMLLILAAIAIAYIAVPAFGNKALIVRSGSMQPTIGVGDLVVVQTQKGLLSPQSITINKYKVGDTIAFSSEKNSKLLTTHRIVAKVVKDGKIFYQTKGDANNAPDQNLVAEENVNGKTTIRLPYFGRLFAFAKSNVGFPLLVIFPALLVIILEMVNIFKEIRRQNRLVQVPAPKESFAGLKIIIPVFMSVMLMHNAFAYFSDTETSTGNIFQAAESFCTPQTGTFWASSVFSSNQGKRKDGSNVLPERSHPNDVLGAPNGVGNPASGFFSLGFGGIIVLQFSSPVQNGGGDDLSFHEITNSRNSYPLEKAKVEVSIDNVTWILLTDEITSRSGVNGVALIDLSNTPVAPSSINYIRITDISDPTIHSSDADGYDLDAVDATILCVNPSPTPTPSPTPNASPETSPTPTPTPAPSEPFADDVIAVTGTFGHCCSDLSSDPAVAKPLVTGAPDSPPGTNFIQISDNSSITLKFVDNKALPTGDANPDIRLHVYDELFPVEATVEVSQNGTGWFSLGNYFDTTDVDLNIEGSGFTEVKYVRLTDLVAGGDPYPTLGFDLDAVEALNSAPE